MPGARANLYLTGMAGAALPDGGPTRSGGLADVQADWENRRLMVMGMARIVHADGLGTSNMQMFRAGFAPWVADYGGVHLWLFGQVRRDSISRYEVEPAFVARIFWRTMMVEAVMKKRKDVSSVHVDLGKGEVHLGLKDGATLSDSDLTRLITDSGYAVTGIDRVDRP